MEDDADDFQLALLFPFPLAAAEDISYPFGILVLAVGMAGMAILLLFARKKI